MAGGGGGGGGLLTRCLQAHAGREPSQERFAPKALSPRNGGELRLPLAAEQTPLCVCGGGAFSGWDRGGKGGGLGCRPPQPHCRTHLPPGLQTSPWLLSGCVGQVGPLRIPDRGKGTAPCGWGRNSATGLGWGRAGNSVLSPCT